MYPASRDWAHPRPLLILANNTRTSSDGTIETELFSFGRLYFWTRALSPGRTHMRCNWFVRPTRSPSAPRKGKQPRRRWKPTKCGILELPLFRCRPYSPTLDVLKSADPALVSLHFIYISYCVRLIHIKEYLYVLSRYHG